MSWGRWSGGLKVVEGWGSKSEDMKVVGGGVRFPTPEICPTKETHPMRDPSITTPEALLQVKLGESNYDTDVVLFEKEFSQSC
eukprot:767579-Hanusia_phi.AAC.17